MEIKKFLPPQYECTICVIGLGYVGLPLAVEISMKKGKNEKHFNKRKIIGFDINEQRIKELNQGIDKTNEVSNKDFNKLSDIQFTSNEKLLIEGDVFLVTTPTPIDDSKKPDLSLLCMACETIGKTLKIRKAEQRKINIPIIIFESTVYPGVTEDICVPIIEKESGLKFNSDDKNKSFVVGYSPERINPGDSNRKLSDIKKVTSGCSKNVGIWIDNFYNSFIDAGTYLAPSIKVAEAAKVIENTQRDLNIALINELSIIMKKLDIDTIEVLKAAETKWNFISFRPGLVGGHCIGVDPYYLTYKAEKVGYYPQVMLAGRRINDYMPLWIVEQIILNLSKKGFTISKSKVLILGLTFKENCPDFRNSKVFNLIQELRSYGTSIEVFDPFVNDEIRNKHLDLKFRKSLNNCEVYEAIVVAVSHKLFKDIDIKKWKSMLVKDGIIFDVKGIVPLELNPLRM